VLHSGTLSLKKKTHTEKKNKHPCTHTHKQGPDYVSKEKQIKERRKINHTDEG
jgi:hypothetical protein